MNAATLAVWTAVWTAARHSALSPSTVAVIQLQTAYSALIAGNAKCALIHAASSLSWSVGPYSAIAIAAARGAGLDH